jgi:hypothetical protein
VCLIGLGRCGSNIALDVAELVYNARKFYLNEFNNEDRGQGRKGYSPAQWIRRTCAWPEQGRKPVFLVEPLVMLGDLDKDIAGRIRFSRKGEKSGFLRDYSKMKIMDLSEVHAGGAGNAPILGQYLAKIILNKDTQRFSSADWKMIHSYLIDSCGIKANQSRLYFSIFSAGGGTGSGMASEFGLAQQHSYMNKTFDTKRCRRARRQERAFVRVRADLHQRHLCAAEHFRSPQRNVRGAAHQRRTPAVQIPVGRMGFLYNFANEDSSEASVMGRIRPWNAMMLISNDIMRYAEESDDGNIQNIDVNAMEKHANQYISQQIFNILTAQAVTTDYDQNYFRRAGIDIGETIRLDANDLFMSLAGPVAIAYAESVVPETRRRATSSRCSKEPQRLNIDDLFFRSIDLPHFNKVTQAIEGISLLPIESSAIARRWSSTRTPATTPRRCTTCTSSRTARRWCRSFLAQGLQAVLHGPEPVEDPPQQPVPQHHAQALCAGDRRVGQPVADHLIAKSPCLSDDFLTLIVAFIKRCFAATRTVSTTRWTTRSSTSSSTRISTKTASTTCSTSSKTRRRSSIPTGTRSSRCTRRSTAN